MWLKVMVIKDILWQPCLCHISKGKEAYAKRYNDNVLLITQSHLIHTIAADTASEYLVYIKEGNNHIGIQEDLLPLWVNEFNRRNGKV